MAKDVRVNDRINAKEVRLIDPDGKQLGIVPLQEALEKARDFGLDLVEVAPNADPPVCRIMDYGKYKYLLSKKEHEAKKKQTIINVKEMKLRPRTDEHDFQVKLKHIKRFLGDGDKVKVTCRFRGREMAYTDQGMALLQRIVEEVKDLGKVEAQPKMEGRAITMVLAPLATKKNQ
ncbi:MAG: translation initiation factor IF-3 [Deltaproteobacteria bacterium]|nr:MAG: translation initiation factor IF-3 [Deltaproteobacteria bacterium]